MKSIVVALLLSLSLSSAQPKYTKAGDFVMPKAFRMWPFLSSGIGMTYSNTPVQNPRFSNVFVNPEALKAFLKTGTWPDKTVLITENRASGSHASNRDGRFQTDVVFWEAHVKDSSRGGWAYYIILKTAKSASPQPVSAGCLACHEKNAATDTTFVQFYPTLIEAAKKAGTFRDPGDVVMEPSPK
jgi:Cytochrome P460